MEYKMEIVKILLYVVEVVVCVLLGLIVMIQKPKEGGLGGAFGASALEGTLGADAGNILVKATAVLGTLLIVNTIVLARISATPDSVVETVAVEEQQSAPAAPVAPAN
jgi:preprotein translocase subunit SecG